MYYVGLDIHTKRISICVLSETGQPVRRCQVRGIEEMLAALQGLPDRFEVRYEASCGYGTTTTCSGRWPRASWWPTPAGCG